AAHVLVSELINEHGDELEPRAFLAVVVEAFKDLAHDHVGMRMPAILGDDGSNGLAFVHGKLQELTTEARDTEKANTDHENTKGESTKKTSLNFVLSYFRAFVISVCLFSVPLCLCG